MFGPFCSFLLVLSTPKLHKELIFMLPFWYILAPASSFPSYPDSGAMTGPMQARPAMLAPACLLLVAICLPTCFLVSRTNPRLPSTHNDFEPRRSSNLGMEGSGSSITIAMAAMTAFAAKALQSKVVRQARIVGFRDDKARMEPNWEETPKPEDRVRNYYYGQRGFKKNQIDPRLRDRDPARMNLGHVTEASGAWPSLAFGCFWMFLVPLF
eukprot:symbB.v1.2.008114.t2/scaffold500.1/size195150/4